MVNYKALTISAIMAILGYYGLSNADKTGDFMIIVFPASLAFVFVGTACVLISIFGAENMPTLFGSLHNDNREIIERLDKIEQKIK